jgi:hypothetical protein
MKINKLELHRLYMEQVNRIVEECDWVTSIKSGDIVNIIANILEKNPYLFINDDTVNSFDATLKGILDDTLYPKKDRVYKMKEDGTFTVEEEVLTNPYAPLSAKYDIEDDVHTREKWQECISGYFSQDKTIFDNNEIIFDEEIIALAKGFMVGPLGAQRGKAIMAGTKNFSTFDKLKETITELAQERDMFLYMIFKQEVIDMTDVDPFTISKEEREKLPKKISYIWRGYLFDRK